MTDNETSMDSVNSQEQPEPADLSMCSSKKAQETDSHVNGFQPKEVEATEDAEQESSQETKDEVVRIKDEHCANSTESMEPESSDHAEVTDLSYGYGSDCPPYTNIQLDRHHIPYDINRPGMGKLYCDICGLACNSLNVLLVHKRSHTGERPFQCNQCGASFTQKGNLLRHGKLHTGEKPFKCHLCSYACQRRDALSGHLRTHSVEKPYKCEFCGRSYKQRSSLEEHKERCRIYLQNAESDSQSIIKSSDDSRQPKPEMGSERAMVLDRLANNVAKRKSSMPQKFIGEKRQCFEVSYNNYLYDKDHDLMPPRIMEQNLGSSMAYLNNDALRPLVHNPSGPTAEMVSVISSLYPMPLTRIEMANGHLPSQGIKEKRPITERGLSPIANAQDSTDTDSSHEERGNFAPGLSMASGRASNVQQLPKEPPRVFDVMKHPGLSQRDLLQVLSKEGCPLGVYRCDHCCVLFLDYVMFTIHMGCHGFRDPFECNMCGHRSQDRYEFSSHIARGEHHVK
ncbi:zinc finger Aiolos [Pelobates cultripes]|uniref:Zinc finger Aiolos n=1 Tax=Pelobates cultripes TaxID=61616 RepID=A0AAD1SMY0_PELCU|nr:zinc finger Aiolos [Pelobates cultripes]